LSLNLVKLIIIDFSQWVRFKTRTSMPDVRIANEGSYRHTYHQTLYKSNDEKPNLDTCLSGTKYDFIFLKILVTGL